MKQAGSLAVAFVLIGAAHAGAQAARDPVRVPRFEVGGQAALLFAAGGDGFLGFDTGPRLTVNLTQRDAVEVATGALFPRGDVPPGLYFLQYKRTLRLSTTRAGDRLFITVGTGGDFYYDHYGEQRETRPDGSVVVVPSRTDAGVDSPWLFTVGFGAERVVARYFASRVEAQVFGVRYGGVGFRGLVGVTVPIGGHYDRQGQ
jgi:hypothetical protein